MKKLWIIIVILVLLGAGAYLGRHKLKNLIGGSSQQATQMAPTQSMMHPTSMVPSNNIYMMKTSSTGQYLTDFQGMTLYTFDKDTSGVSNCTGTCAKTWTPYSSGATAQGSFPTNISVITRSDGSKQFAWKGMSLYYYSNDAKVGDMTGDGFGGVWHIVKQ